LASVALTVKVCDEFDVGVPETTPVEGAKLRPAGKEPERIVYVYGPVPPEAVIV
jgi:hypothetical protein